MCVCAGGEKKGRRNSCGSLIKAGATLQVARYVITAKFSEMFVKQDPGGEEMIKSIYRSKKGSLVL